MKSCHDSNGSRITRINPQIPENMDEEIDTQKPSREAVDRASACSDYLTLPIRLLRMVVQVEDTPANRTALSVARSQLLRDSTFDGVQNVVKIEQLAVISLCKPNAESTRAENKS